MRSKSITCRVLLTVAALVSLSGCAAAVRHAPEAPEVEFTTSTVFRLHPLDNSQQGCSVQKAVLRLFAVRGDTVFFRSAAPSKWPTAAPRCAVEGAGFVVVSAHPELRARERKPPSGLQIALSFSFALAVGLGALALWAIAAQ
ncbi:MAG TPA: hypothetical protein PKE51_02905 [Gemmatimonadaceae bacterium]|nr:hypothetical protein [Gemmatimonadaceae bacterium]